MSGAEAAYFYMAAAAVSTYATVQSAQANAEAADRNAEIADMQAKAEEARLRRENERRMGMLRTNIAKSGVRAEGTPLLVLAESAELAELDAMNVRWSGRVGAESERTRARNARASIPYTVGAGLLSGASGYYSMKPASAGT